MLRWRLLLGALLIAALVGLLWVDYTVRPGLFVFLLALGVGAAATHEIASLVAATGHDPLLGGIYGGNMLVIASNAIPMFGTPAIDDQPLERLGWPLVAFALSLLAALVAEISRYRRGGEAIVNAGLAVLAIAYVGVLLSFALQLRMLGGPSSGMLVLVALIVTVKFGDTGAYTIGRLFGRHRLAPSLSPGKTIEGAVGAIVAACAGAWLTFTYLPMWLGTNPVERTWAWLVFGVAVGVAGLVGDLAESLLKRDVGAKDSSALLPGFGGVLDLVDSILFAAPVAYVCALLGMT